MKYLVREYYTVKNDEWYLDWGMRNFYIYYGKENTEQSRVNSMPDPSDDFVKAFGFDTKDEANELMADIVGSGHEKYESHTLEETAVVVFDEEWFSV